MRGPPRPTPSHGGRAASFLLLRELFHENLADNIAKAEDKWAEKVDEFAGYVDHAAKLEAAQRDQALTH